MKKKRSVKDIPIFLDKELFEELKLIVKSVKWPYKTNMSEFQLRDQALVCLLILTGLRVGEALRLKKLQFRVYDREIILKNVVTLKRGNLRSKIILPKAGSLAWFTELFEGWLCRVPKDSYVFPSGCNFGFIWSSPLSRKRVHWILKTTVNRFPHWFRSVCETIYGRIIFKNNAWKLKEFMGLKNLESTTPYVQSPWEEDLENIYQI